MKVTWQTVAQIIGSICLMVGIAFGSYFAYNKYTDKTLFSIVIATIVLNVVVSISWLYGAAKEKRYLMLPALIVWATVLAVYTCFAFISFIDIFLFHRRMSSFLTVMGLVSFLISYILASISYMYIEGATQRNTTKYQQSVIVYTKDTNGSNAPMDAPVDKEELLSEV